MLWNGLHRACCVCCPSQTAAIPCLDSIRQILSCRPCSSSAQVHALGLWSKSLSFIVTAQKGCMIVLGQLLLAAGQRFMPSLCMHPC